MIGEKIYRIRKSRGLTLSELAERANVSKSYLSNIERNVNQNPSIQVVEKLATVLGVEFTILVEGNSEIGELLEPEWIDFINDLKEMGVKKEQLSEYREILKFIKWQKEEQGNDK
ncbi:helix-turn-helix transcriptional regulator [Priestia flexa]|uniref:helix-turn-helix domain-containing protein n=1 Tax=Priestia flexa TaxID=86664 RepID=UPI000C233608|nr:helix-turn-helix transcriptional regulator [Priestia flexa]MEC0664805.1 helix-turn-helix transcriptional regulator [Priestia flexa]